MFFSRFRTIAVLPQLTPEGHKVVVTKLWSCDPAKVNLTECCKLFAMLAAMGNLKYGTYDGFVFLLDLEGAVFGHLLRIPIFVVKRFFNYLQEGMPVRLRKVHIFNLVPFMDKILNLVRPLMKKELFELIELHSSIESLQKVVPAEILPCDYPGGKADSIEKFHRK